MLKPNNPIKTVEELESLAGKEIFHVSQSGSLTAFTFTGITSFNELYNFIDRDEDHWGWEKSSFVGTHTTDPFIGTRKSGGLGDVNIGGHFNEHHLFANKGDADDYSKQMKIDPEYIQSVKDHHARCNEWDQWD